MDDHNEQIRSSHTSLFHYATIVSFSVLITAVVVAVGMYFTLRNTSSATLPQQAEENIPHATSTLRSEKADFHIISSTITSTSPLETTNLVLTNTNAYLSKDPYTDSAGIELDHTESYIRDLLKNRDEFMPIPTVSLHDVENYILIEIVDSTGGMAPTDTVTMFAINTSNNSEKKLYTFRQELGNDKEGAPTGPSLLSLSNHNDIVLHCAEGDYGEEPFYRLFTFTDCDLVYVVEKYTSREYDERKRLYTYYDENGNVLEPRILSNKNNQEAIVYSRYNDLLNGAVSIAIGTKGEVLSGGENRELFELSFGSK